MHRSILFSTFALSAQTTPDQNYYARKAQCQFELDYLGDEIPTISFNRNLFSEDHPYHSCVDKLSHGVYSQITWIPRKHAVFSLPVDLPVEWFSGSDGTLDPPLIMAFGICLIFLFVVVVRMCWIVGVKAKPLKPRYWSTSSQLHVLSDNFYREVDITSTWGPTFQDLVDRTTLSQFIGIGRDAAGMTHSRLRVTRVLRIENGALWTKYCMTKSHMPESCETSEMASKLLKVLNRSPLNGERLVRKMNLNKARGETLLFHGAPSGGAIFPSGYVMPEKLSAMHTLKRQGFDERLGSMDGMYGSGIYFADAASKADAYAGRYGYGESTGENAKFIVARVLMGSSFVTKCSLPRMRRAPCIKGHFDPRLMWETVESYDQAWHKKFKAYRFQRCQHELRNSVIAGHEINGAWKNYCEFVIYDGSQAYPEYIVHYTRE